MIETNGQGDIFCGTQKSNMVLSGGLQHDVVDTVIVEKKFEHATSHFEYCGLKTETYDDWLGLSCSAKVIPTPEEAVQAERASLQKLKGSRTFYYAYKSNCDHWVNVWKYGILFCLQINNCVVWANKKASPECEAPRKIECT